MDKPILLRMTGIDKSFAGVHALNRVDFEVGKGEVHALMGENGAGKSTLIKVLTGVYFKDAGTIVFDGKELNPKTSLDAQRDGISTIYQELNLVPFQKVYENIYLGREPRTKLGTIDRKKMMADADAVLQGMGISIDVDVPLNRYSTAIQQMVAIARALTIRAKLVIMDEPTSSLDTKEVEVLFGVIRRLAAQGVSVIFISHRLEEVFQICERMTILRNGEVSGKFPIGEISVQQLVSLMIGREYNQTLRQKGAYGFADAGTLVEMWDIAQGVKLRGIDVEIKKGEVLGLAGLLGSGRTELSKVLFGAEMPDEGEVLWLGKRLKLHAPKNTIRAGMGYCTEDRKAEGIYPHLSVKENITIAMLPQLTKAGVVSQKKQMKIVNAYIERLQIKTPSPEQSLRFLSGGNQQKVLLARWLCMNPKLLILDEPTRGIDVGTKAEIERLIQEFAQSGISVLMISSEMEELVRNCDRIVVIRDGHKLGELTDDEISIDCIMDTIAKSHSDLSAAQEEVFA